METLWKKKSTAAAQLLRMLHRFETTLDTDATEAARRHTLLTSAHSAYATLGEQLLLKCKDTQVSEIHEEMDTMFNRCDSMVARLHKLSSTPAPTPHPLPTADTNDLPLPALSLPHFDGAQDDYPAFMAKFMSIVDTKAITDVKKFQYLSGFLRGKAYNIISHLDYSDASYTTALALLHEKYSNPRRQIFSLLGKLVQQPVATRCTELDSLLDVTQAIYHALSNCGHPVGKSDALFVYLMMQKLDPATSAEFQRSMRRTVPSAQDFLTFLSARCSTLDEDEMPPPSPRPHTNTSRATVIHKKEIPPLTNDCGLTCPACDGRHYAITCPRFSAMSIQQRRQTVIDKKLCFNCMQAGHTSAECKSSNCKKCAQKHHTLLHFPLNVPTNVNASCLSPTSSLLTTAIVPVQASDGTIVTLRAMLDSGSNITLISRSALSTLGLYCQPQTEKCFTISAAPVSTLGTVQLTISPQDGGPPLTAEAKVVNQIVSCYLPDAHIDTTAWTNVHKVHLADPTFNIPGPIELLLSNSIFFSLLEPARIRGTRNAPDAWKTRLGYVLTGAINAGYTPAPARYGVCNFNFMSGGQSAKWELDKPSDSAVIPEEEACENVSPKDNSVDCASNNVIQTTPWLTKYSSLIKLCRVLAYSYQFVNKLKKHLVRPIEPNKDENSLIAADNKLHQKCEIESEMNHCQQGLEVLPSSSLKPLMPLSDSNGIVMNNTVVTREEENTILAQIGECLNSRPLCPMSDDPEDVTMLTPDPWRKLRQSVQFFWRLWQTEYLNKLRSRLKWMNHHESMQIKELVIIREENLPPTQWRLGRILQTHPGPDGRVRVVTIKTTDGTMKRAICQVSKLPID